MTAKEHRTTIVLQSAGAERKHSFSNADFVVHFAHS